MGNSLHDNEIVKDMKNYVKMRNKNKNGFFTLKEGFKVKLSKVFFSKVAQNHSRSIIFLIFYTGKEWGRNLVLEN